MENLFKWLEQNITKAVGVPAILSIIQFFAQLIKFSADGVIDEEEFYQLMTTGSNVSIIISVINMAILVIVYLYLKVKGKTK